MRSSQRLTPRAYGAGGARRRRPDGPADWKNENPKGKKIARLWLDAVGWLAGARAMCAIGSASTALGSLIHDCSIASAERRCWRKPDRLRVLGEPCHQRGDATLRGDAHLRFRT